MADKRIEFDFGHKATDTQARHLALILQAIEDTELESAESRTEFKKRLTTLQNDVAKLTRDILSGQLPLVAEVIEQEKLRKGE